MNKNLFLILTTVATLCGCSDDRVNSLDPSQSGTETNGNTMSFSISAEDYDDPNGILASQTRSDLPSMSPCTAQDILSSGFIMSAYDEYGDPLFENYLCKVEDGKWKFYDRESMEFNTYGVLQSLGDPVSAPGWPEVEEGEDDPVITFYAIFVGGADEKRIVKDEDGNARFSFDNSRFLMNSFVDDMVCQYEGSRADGQIQLNFKHIVSLFKAKVKVGDASQNLEVTQIVVSAPRYVDYNFYENRVEKSLDESGVALESKIGSVLDGNLFSLPDASAQVVLTETADWGEEGAVNYWGVLRPYDSDLTLSVAFKVGESDFVNYRSTNRQPAAGVMSYYSITLSEPTNEMVDLGLSAMWASCNVGAASPSDAGAYFAWGEVVPFGFSDSDNSNINGFNRLSVEELDGYSDYYNGSTLANFQYMNSSVKGYYTQSTYKYCTSDAYTQYYGGAGVTELTSDDDAASVNMGSIWSIPTVNDWKELVQSCDWTLTTMGSVPGYQIVGPSKNSIFLPLVGIVEGGEVTNSGSEGITSYWTSELFVPEEGEAEAGETAEDSQANVLYISGSGGRGFDALDRGCVACPVRAVCKAVVATE